jgi:hypothetical protein
VKKIFRKEEPQSIDSSLSTPHKKKKRNKKIRNKGWFKGRTDTRQTSNEKRLMEC